MNTHAPTSPTSWGKLPVIVALVLLITGGIFLLDRADAQARDTTRKHHLEDLEGALYFARTLHGTYPPYEETQWCGVLTAPGNELVLAQVEEVLRAQHEKYANPDKPFPTDPLLANRQGVPAEVASANQTQDYFYWKHSPASFELYAILEVEPTGERATQRCETTTTQPYDYGIASLWRQT